MKRIDYAQIVNYQIHFFLQENYVPYLCGKNLYLVSIKYLKILRLDGIFKLEMNESNEIIKKTK